MPFTKAEFFSVFAGYNIAIWPLQVALYLAGLVVVILLFQPSRPTSIAICLLLAFMWVVNGTGYHWIFFSDINPIANWFGMAFIGEAVLLVVTAMRSGDFRLEMKRDARSAASLILILFAMLLYPLWGFLAGHHFPAAPVFGATPCPTTIFTIGVLMAGSWKTSRWLLIIPALWSLIGTSAALLLDVPQDLGLLASFILAAVFGIQLQIRSVRSQQS